MCSIRARSTISEDPTPNSTKTEQKVTGREPHSVTPHEPRRLGGSRQTLHGGLLPPLPSGQLPLRVTTSSQHRAPAAILPVLRPPSSPASGSLPPRAPAAFLAAPWPPPSPASGLLPPHAPAAFLPKIRPPSTPEIPAPVPNPFVRELGDWDSLLAAASLLAVSGGSGVVAGTLSCSSPTTVKLLNNRSMYRPVHVLLLQRFKNQNSTGSTLMVLQHSAKPFYAAAREVKELPLGSSCRFRSNLAT
ncbi:uncharacterized protein KIAA0754 [Triticum aestivum]|uniref:uncharacterized protein KIAA0754 n=1 Tax=Triticum aestivum TaxID=4565 RepID=UPI001D00B227|nr:uncharacterized protein KIAA0754-like [Triticum aestivum]